MPLTMAPMACSRTPKCRLRPRYSPAKKSPAPSKVKLVLLECARSAEPPMSQGIFLASAFRTLPEESREAMPLASAGELGAVLVLPPREREEDVHFCSAPGGGVRVPHLLNFCVRRTP